MRIGLKTRRLTFEVPTDTADEYGDAGRAWATHATVWASIEPLRGDERYEVQQVTAEVTHKIRVRYSALMAAVTPKYRAVQGGTYFDILSVNDIMSAHRELEIYAKVRP